MRQPGTSQQTIARTLGCSQALVSFALNGKRVVDRKSYRRIWECAIKQGYRPKGMQVHSSPVASKWVAILAGDSPHALQQGHCLGHVFEGLRAALAIERFNTLLIRMETHSEAELLADQLKRNNLSGVVILGQIDERLVGAILPLQRHLVAVGASYPGLCHSVMANEREALELLVEHLAALGHRRFAWIGGDKSLREHGNGNTTLAVTLAQRGLELIGNRTAQSIGADRLGGRKAAESILERCPPRSLPTAWICQNALLARGVINLLTQKKKPVPEGFSVVALDATPVCDEEYPRLTGANTDPVKLASKAAEILLHHVGNGDGSLSNVVLPAQLTVRESTASAIGKPALPRDSR